MKKTLAVLLVLAMVLSLAACGETKQENTAASEKVFNNYLNSEPSSLDVSRTSDSYSSTILNNTVESLVRTMRDESGEYFTAPGDAATWDVSEDGKVWTFHLQENAKWADGEPVTAGQYVYSLRRSADPATGCPQSFFLTPIKNFAAVNAGTMAVEELGVEAPDDHTLVIGLENELPAFLQMLSTTIYYPQREDYVSQYGDQYGSEADKVICNGPFKVTEWVHNNKIVLEKNDQYWDAENVHLDKVIYNIMTDETTYYNAFASGDLDYVSTGLKTWMDQFSSDENNVYVGYPTATLLFDVFNAADPVFSNAKIRKAFVLATDCAKFNELVCDGLRTPTYGWIVPSMTVDGISFRETVGDLTKTMAEELAAEGKTPKDLLLEGMKEAGLGDDPSTLKITLALAGTSDWYRNAADFYVQEWNEALGVTIDSTYNEWGIFWDNIEKGNYQIAMMSWGAYYNDPYDTLSVFWSDAAAINTGWESEEFDKALTTGMITMDPAQRLEYYRQAEEIAIKDACIAIPLTTSNINGFVKKNVKNWAVGAYNNQGLKFVDIE